MTIVNFLARRRMKTMLEDCDYKLASNVIAKKFGANEDSLDSSNRLQDFILNPCLKTAIKLIDSDPLFTYYFLESKPGGHYFRMHSVRLGQPVQDKEPSISSSEKEFIDTKATPPSSSSKQRDDGLKEIAAASMPTELPPRGMSRSQGMTKSSSGSSASSVNQFSPDSPVASAGKGSLKKTANSVNPVGSSKSSVISERSAVSPAPRAIEPIEVQRQEILKSRQPTIDFTNVISTLKIDIQQLEEQVKVLERHMLEQSVHERERDQLEQAARIYKEGIHEFSEAVKLLQMQSARPS